MKSIVLSILSAIAVFGQAQTPFKVFQSPGSATGAVWLQERRTNGTNVIKIEAPQSIAADFPLVLPGADGTIGQCLKTDGSGALGWAACGSEFPVTAYGAVCDGVTDDTTAVQAAITAAEGLGGGLITLPTGTCNVTTLEVGNNFVGFQGQGRSMSVLVGISNATVIHIDTTSGDIYAFEMRNMTLQGNGGTTSAGVTVDGANDFFRSVFSNLYIANARRGLWIKNSGYADWLHFRDNICDMSLVTTGTCLDIESGLTSPGGIIANNQFIQGSGGTAIYYHGDFGDIVISGNHSESGSYFLNADCDMGCTYGERLVVTGNKIDNTTTAPMRINNVNNSKLFPNVILGSVATPVVVAGTSTGNIYDANYNHGIIMSVANAGLDLNGSAAGRIRVGDIDENVSNTTNGISIKDDAATVAIGIGQETARSVGLLWAYNATPADAYGVLYTFGKSNPLVYQAEYHSFETTTSGSIVAIGPDTADSSTFRTSATDNATIFDGYSTVGPTVQLRGARGSSGTPGAVIQNDSLGLITFGGYKATGRGANTAAIRAYADEDFTDSTAATYMGFWTTPTGSTTRVERLRISAAGHLLFPADASYDLGETAANRPRDGHFGRNVLIAGTLGVTGNTGLNGANNTMSGNLAPGFDNLGSIGTSSLRYADFYGYDMDLAANLSAAVINATGSPAYRVAGTSVILADRSASFTGLTINTSTPSVVGQCWIATDTAGAGEWDTCFGGTITSHLLFSPDNTYNIGAVGANRPIDIFLTGGVVAAGNSSMQTLTLSGSLVMGATTVINNSRNLEGLNAFAQNLLPSANTTYSIGNVTYKVLDVHTSYVDLYTDLTMNTGATFTGSLIPSTNNLYALGNTSFRVSNIATVNANFSGTITAPSGNTGSSVTISLRKGDDSGACNVVISGGIVTSNTC